MSPDWLKFFWEVMVTVVSTAAFIVAWWGGRQRANKDALNRVESHLEAEVKALTKGIADGLDRVEANLDAKIKVQSDSRLGETQTFRRVFDEHSRRITISEEAMKFAPKSDDINKLRDSITALSTELARFDGTQRSLERTVDRMNQHLMEKV